jgi:uncharacterized protein YndB with AHSA1/START domain
MPEASNETMIAQPPEVVFAYLANAENDAEWRPAVIEIARAHGDGVGTRYRQVVGGPGGRRIDADIEITEYEPDRRLAFRTVAGPVRPTGTYELDPADGGTRVRFTLRADLTGPKRLMAPMVRKAMASEVANLENLKRKLEAN